jgi:hypothetical protein
MSGPLNSFPHHRETYETRVPPFALGAPPTRFS